MVIRQWLNAIHVMHVVGDSMIRLRPNNILERNIVVMRVVGVIDAIVIFVVYMFKT